MNIEDIMTENVIYCRPDDPVKHAARLLREHKISGIPVVKGDKVVGILTENDILKLLEVPERDNQLWLPSPLEVIEVPLRELISWEETRHALEDVGSKNVASRMVKHKINRVPVVEDGKLVGIVTRQDIISGMALAVE
jgi:CBS domain-containing protein